MSAQLPNSTSTRVDRVVVYPRGARVVRVGRAGPGPVRVEDLPLTYASDSLRVRPASGRVRDVEETCRLVHTPVAEAPPPSDEVLAAERARDRALRVRDAVRERLEGLEGLAPAVPAEGPAALPDPTALLARHDLASDRLARLDAELARAEAAWRLADKALARARRQPPAGPPPRFHRGVTFELVDCDAETTFEIEYFVDAARWVPAYRVDLDTPAGKGPRARLRSEALVAQASGEDWRGAEIRFAFADPQRATDLPRLTGWRIGTPRPAPSDGFRAPPEGTGALFNAFDAGRPKTPTLQPTARSAPQKPMAPPRMQPPSESAAPPPPPKSSASFGGGPVGAAMPAPSAPMPAPMADMADMARSSNARRMASSDRDEAPMAKRSRGGAPGALGGGGGGGDPAEETEAVAMAPPEAGGQRVPPHAYLRLAGADEPHRGTLRPVDPLTHLATLAGDHDVEAPERLRQAVAALRAEASGLAANPAPPGTTVPSGEAWHGLARAEGRHDVPADAGWHRLVVRSDEAPAERVWRCVPRHAEDVFRVAELHAPAGLPAPTGPLQVYLDGRFATTATLDGRSGGGRLNLNLGLDPAVRVVERTARVSQSDKGLMTQSTRVDHEVTLRLRNGHPHPVRVQIYDRLPTAAAGADDVKVTALESSPEPELTHTNPDGQLLRGGVRWQLDLAAGTVGTVVWRYRVEFPAKLELSGGNRRE